MDRYEKINLHCKGKVEYNGEQKKAGEEENE